VKKTVAREVRGREGVASVRNVQALHVQLQRDEWGVSTCKERESERCKEGEGASSLEHTMLGSDVQW